jgi:hypothetical protein
MTTYKEMYDDMLNECYCDIPWKKLPRTPAELMEDNDPTMYRCGFSDWLDSLEDVYCTSRGCDRVISRDTVQDASEEDEVVCEVCAGTHFVCRDCGELFPVGEQSEDDELCKDCYEHNKEDEDEGEISKEDCGPCPPVPAAPDREGTDHTTKEDA